MISEDHKSIIEAVKLAMEIIEAKISNCMGYAYLILSKADSQIFEIAKRTQTQDLASMLEKERKDIKNEKDAISNKMFPYELKGLDDWRKYLRGKFFEEEKTILVWYRMVSYLNAGKLSGLAQLGFKPMADTVKGILY